MEANSTEISQDRGDERFDPQAYKKAVSRYVTGDQSSETVEHNTQCNMRTTAEPTTAFEVFIKLTLAKILQNQDELKKEFESFKTDIIRSVEFQGEQIGDLEKRTVKLETGVSDIGSRSRHNTTMIDDLCQDINKLERHSRRNNIRIIGYNEEPGENIMEIVNDIIRDIFGLHDVCVERAH